MPRAKTINYDQMKRYRASWAEVKKMLTEIAAFSDQDAEEERHAITRAALGQDKSSKDFTQRDLDAVLDHFDQYLVLIKGPQSGPTRADSQPVKRLVWAIEHLGLPEPYIQSIARDQFGTSDWRGLTERQLIRFRFTCTARAAALKRAAKAQQ